MVVLSPASLVQVLPAGMLYAELRRWTDAMALELNVEGAVLQGARIRLLQRGNGTRGGTRREAGSAVLDLALDDVLAWLQGDGAPPVVTGILRVDLGEKDGVPSAAMGQWRWNHDGVGFTREYEMNVRQTFQFINGSASSKTTFAYLRDMTLSGDRISFVLTEEAGSSLAQTRYEGRIEGDTITGTARTNNQPQARPWRATRVAGRTEIEARK